MEWNIYLTVSTLVLIVSGKQKVDIIQDISGKNVRDDEINYTVHPRPGMSVDSKYYTDEAEFDDEMPDEQRLMRYLFRNYEKTVRPVKNASTPVEIRMGLTMAQIFDMDEKDQVLVTNVWLDQEWVDEFMIWDPTDFANITMLRIPCEKLWLPDIVLYNKNIYIKTKRCTANPQPETYTLKSSYSTDSAKPKCTCRKEKFISCSIHSAAEYTDGQMPARAMVRHDGNVFWPIPTKLQSSCKVDVTYFPFDEQRCKMKFGSWTYDGFQVNIINRTSEVDLSNYVNNGEWELLKIIIVRNVMYYACCPEPFPDVTFYIEIRRRTLYYMYNVIFPCIMMSALTLLVFCLPPDSGEKIALGITVLLAFSVFMLAVAENLPETSEFVPLISIYLTIVMALTSMSVIMTVFVLNLHHRGPNKKEVPAWLKDLLLRKLKTSIYLTIVMALTSMSVIMTVFVLNLHHRGPNKKEVPAWLKVLLLRKLKTCIYLTIVMALTSMSVIMTVFVLNLHHRGPNKKEVPAWLKDLLLRKLAPVLCLHDLNIDPGRYYNNEERFIKNVSLKITLDNIQQALQNETQIDNNRAEPSATTVTVQEPFQNAVPQMTGNAVSQSGQHVQKPTMANNTPKTSSQVSNRHLEHVYPTVHLVNSTNKPSNESRESPQSQNRHSVIYHQTNSNASSVIYTSQTTPVSNSEQRRQKRRSNSNLSRTNEEILSSLKRILEKHEKEDRDYEIIQEWRRVAQCVDRILFFVFLVATLSSTIGILVLAPALQ